MKHNTMTIKQLNKTSNINKKIYYNHSCCQIRKCNFMTVFLKGYMI